MEYDQDEQNQEGGFFSRLKESPRTVSVLIIILIVAAAIYAFSGNDKQKNNGEEAAENPATEQVAGDNSDQGTTSEEATEGSSEAMNEGDQAMKAAAATPQPVSPETLSEQSKALPEGQVTDSDYIEKAQHGDGVTHLARRAATRYLTDNTPGYELTNEHRIYIEDYIKDHIGSQRLSPDQEVTISKQLIQEAVDSAGKLSASQLQNLHKYVYVLN